MIDSVIAEHVYFLVGYAGAYILAGYTDMHFVVAVFFYE